MPSRVYADDPAIPGTERLLRRIPQVHLKQDPHGSVCRDANGRPEISSAAFKDRELSVNIESVMGAAGRAPEDAIRRFPGYGLAALTAGQARSLGQAVAPDPTVDEPAHGVVYGNKSKNTARTLRDGADWVVVTPT